MDEELCKKAVYSNEYYDLILDYIGGYSMGPRSVSNKWMILMILAFTEGNGHRS